MAETAAILCPDKQVLLPDLEAGCSLADSPRPEQLRAWKEKHPGAVVVSYVNTSAEVKAESDYCCTSSNAAKVVNAIPPDREDSVFAGPVPGPLRAQVTGRKLHLWLGECHVHAGMRPDVIAAFAPPTRRRRCWFIWSAAARHPSCTIRPRGTCPARLSPIHRGHDLGMP